MFRVLLVCVAVALSLAHGAAMPLFSWDTLPVYYHSSNGTGPYTDEAIGVIARYPIVTIEKFQGKCWQTLGTPACDQEEIILTQLRRVKARNSSIQAILYQNSILDFAQYRLHAEIELNFCQLLDVHGNIVKMGGGGRTSDVYDFTRDECAQLYIDDCVNATKNGADGCFADRTIQNMTAAQLGEKKAQAWNDAHWKTLKRLQSLIEPGMVIANHGYSFDGASAAMVEACESNANGFSWLQESIKNGKIVECHSPHCNDENSMAMFLILVEKYAYYGCGPWTFTDNTTAADLWSPNYDKPLGAPMSAAVLKGTNYERHFASGTWVEWDHKSFKGTIHWAS